jgi:hypothetical protein
MKRMIITVLIMTVYIGGGVICENDFKITSPPFYAFYGFWFGVATIWINKWWLK